MKNSLKLLLCIIIPLAIGAVIGIATTSGIDTWYVNIEKPSFNPPNNLFGPVWTTLYILMGISFYMILQAQKNELRTKAIDVFCTKDNISSVPRTGKKASFSDLTAII